MTDQIQQTENDISSPYSTIMQYGIRDMWDFRVKFYAMGRWQLKRYKEFVNTLNDGDKLPFLNESLDLLRFYCGGVKEAERIIVCIKHLISDEPEKIRIYDFDKFIEKMNELNEVCLHRSNTFIASFISKNFDTGYAESTIKRRLGE